MEGQFTGSRSKYIYTDDAGTPIILTLDDTLVIVGSGLVPYDPATPPAGACPKPTRFKPRGVYWQATAEGFEGKRKFLIAGDPNGVLYASNTPAAISIDLVAGVTTGRTGEDLSF